jgi:hypothetical protein
VNISPEPTDEEAAAIVAAIHAATPAGGGAAGEPPVPRWRWSGRWWSRPIPARRTRPW